MDYPDHLPRLQEACYQGRAWIHWTLGIRDRSCGWLDAAVHASFRELLLHAGARYHLHSPAYCMMPDHVHLLWMGISPASDQKRGMRFLRRYWNELLAGRGISLQPQAYDHVLRKDERSGDEFEDTVLYIRKNPERAGLVKEWKDWPYGGVVVPGYPDLPAYPAMGFWAKFWKVHHLEVRAHFKSPEM